MNLVLVLGAQGVGKTSLVEHAIEKTRGDYEVINFGSVLQEVIEGADRDKFRRQTSIERYWGIQKATARDIDSRISDKENVILTSHGVLYKKAGWYPGFPEDVLDILEPKMILVVKAKPKNIIKRREKGGTEGRTRDKTPKEIVREEQESTVYISFAYSMHTGATVKIIDNKEGKLEEASSELANALDNL